MAKFNILHYQFVRILLLVSIFFSFYSSMQAQDVDRCVTTENTERLKLLFPEYEENRKQLEIQIKEIIERRDEVNGIVVIPVVYHIIHNGDAIGSSENLSLTLLQAQLDQMNDDFRRTNSDAGNTPTAFTGAAADSEIEFCLAQLDPSSNPTTGINRINISTLSGVNTADCWTASYIDANIKTSTIWDRNKYLNIWTVSKINRTSDCANTVLGFAQFPGLPANTDGVVLRATTVGSIANPNPNGGNFALGRTGTHEVGHWLNLIHIWGDGDCTVDDAVSDTPIADGPNYNGSPCTFPGGNSCDEGTGDMADMFQNYMDYSDDVCMNLFTTGQKSRMQAAIIASRADLLTSLCAPACTADLTLTGTLSGDYISSNTIITDGTTNVPNGNTVNLRSSNYIRLNPGFSSSVNAGLDIRFGSCSALSFRTNVDEDLEAIFSSGSVHSVKTFTLPSAEELIYFRTSPSAKSKINSSDYTEEEKKDLIARDRIQTNKALNQKR